MHLLVLNVLGGKALPTTLMLPIRLRVEGPTIFAMAKWATRDVSPRMLRQYIVSASNSHSISLKFMLHGHSRY